MARIFLPTLFLLLALFLALPKAYALDKATMIELFPQGKIVDHYDVLGVSPSAKPDLITKIYRKKATILHPDHGGDEEQFKLIKTAYEILRDPEKRKAYNKIRRKLMAQDHDAPLRIRGDLYDRAPHPLDLMPKKFKTSDHNSWNYFEVIEARGTANHAEIEAAIEKKEKLYEKILKENPMLSESLAPYQERLEKAREILLDPDLKSEYFNAAKKVRIAIKGKFKNRSLYSYLKTYTPDGQKPSLEQKCWNWFQKLSPNF